MGDDDLAHGVEKFVQQAHQDLRFHGFRQAGEAPDIGKKNGQLPALAAETQELRVFYDFIHHVRGDVRLKGLLEVCPLLFFRQEPLHGEAHGDAGDGQQGAEQLQLPAPAAKEQVVDGGVASRQEQCED